MLNVITLVPRVTDNIMANVVIPLGPRVTDNTMLNVVIPLGPRLTDYINERGSLVDWVNKGQNGFENHRKIYHIK